MKKLILKGLDEVVFCDKCKNGLNIYMCVNKKVKNFYATLNVKYGAIDTEFSVNNKIIKTPKGIAHFLEHLKFNQPDGISAHEYYSKLGSNINAFTTHDFTAYEVIAAKNFKDNITYLLDYVQTPYFTKDAIKKEKGIIIEEIKMYDDNPGFKLYTAMNEALFNIDNRKYMVSGTIADVRKTTDKDMYKVFDTFYHPENMFIIITGNFDPIEAVTLIKENQNKKTFSKYQNPTKITQKEDIKVASEYKEIFGNIETPKIKIAFKMNRNNFKNISDLDLKLYLNSFLRATFGETSVLQEKLLQSNLITGEIVLTSTVRDNYVILSLLTETNYPNEVIKIFREVMSKPVIKKEELERKKKVSIASSVLSYDDIEMVNSEMEEDLITYGQIITNMISHLKKLTIDEANKILKKIKTDNYSVVILYPLQNEKK